MSTPQASKDLSTSVSNQITNLVKTLNKKNYRANVAEIEKLVNSFGYEAYKFFLRFLIKDTNLGSASKDQLKIQLLGQEFAQLTNKQNPAVIIDVLEGVQGSKIELLQQLAKSLPLQLSQQLVVALCLTQSIDITTQQEAINFIKIRLPEILETGASVLPEPVIHQFLHFVTQYPDFAKDKEKIFKAFEHVKPHLLTSAQFLNPSEPTNSRRSFQNQPEPPTSEIAGLLKDVGSICTVTEETCSKFFTQVPSIVEKDVSAMIGVICANPAGLEDSISLSKNLFGNISLPEKKGWNVSAFVAALKKKNNSLNWKKVLLGLDYTGFKVADQKALGLLTSMYKFATDDGLPAECIIGTVWQNRNAQLGLLSLALDAPPDTISFAAPSLRFADLGPVASLAKNVPIAWTCLEFVEVLLELADEDNYGNVRKLFEYPLKNFPELLIVVLSQAKPKNQQLQKDLLVTIAPTFIRVHKNTNIVLAQLYHVNPQLLMHLFVDSYLKDQGVLRRILDISQELKILPAVLETQHFRFIIDFAVLAAKRDHLNLELWLGNNIEKFKTPFVQELVSYFVEKLKTLNESKQQPADKSASFSPDIIPIFLRSLNAKKHLYPAELFDQVVHLLQNEQKTRASAPEFHISPEIEEKANAYFKDIFGSRLSIDEAIDLLKNLKASKLSSDQELFTCMIHNLFDEYRFFPQYPVAELRIVAKLFGSIVQHNIIAAKSLLLALKAVLKALSEPNDQKMFQFGVIALNQFKTSIPNWPFFAQALRAIPALPQAIPDILYFLNSVPAQGTQQGTQGFGSQDFETPSQPQQPAPFHTAVPTQPAPDTTTITPATPAENETPQLSAPPSMGFQLDISTLTKNKAQEIDEESADKIRFIINNTTLQNLNDKVADLKKFIKLEHYAFLAHYLVTNRASLEPNYHQTYIKVLDALKIKDLDSQVLKCTYENIKLLLGSERIKTVTSERTLLKNLGTWLGLLTIEKNKPILLKDLDLKTLLLTAYEQGKLIGVIPFICKILNHCQNSVIKYPNPWVVGLLSVLVEIHDIPDIKTNIKFEVEVLFKNLKLKIADIEKKDHLQGRKVNMTNNPDFRTAPAASTTAPLLPHTDYSQPINTGQAQGSRQLFNFSLLPDIVVAQDLHEQIKIHESLTLFTQNPAFEKLVVLAIDRAIREIISPIVKRSVVIACKTTTELVCKDFALETDPVKFKRAANTMAQNLASKLAMVTCKDPLKSSMQHHLKTLLVSIAVDPSDAGLLAKIEEAVQIICNDNVDLGCVFVEKAASEKAVQDITDALAGEIESRRKHLQSAGQHAYTQYVPPVFVQTLPEGMYPRTGLTPLHLATYEDFKLKADGSEELKKKEIPYSHQEAIAKIDVILEEVNAHIAKSKKNVSLISIPQDSDLLKYLLIAPNALRQCSISPEIVLYLFTSLIKTVIEADSVLVRDTYAYMIEVCREVFKKLNKQITSSWASLEGESKFNADIISLLIRTKIFSVNEFDIIMGMFCAQNVPSAIKLALNIVKKSIVEDKVINVAKIPRIFDFLSKNAKALPESDQIIKLLETAKATEVVGRAAQLTLAKLKEPDFEPSELDAIRGKVNTQFNDWLNLRESQPQMDRSPFINQIQRSGLIKTDADFEKFCVILTGLCVENFHNMSLQENVSDSVLFKYIDAFSELVALILKFSEEKYKLTLLTKATFIVSKYLVREHETQNEKFNQRVYLRFFSDLLLELNINPENPVDMTFLNQFYTTFLALQPLYLPGFALAWLELISHRAFMPKLLFAKQKGMSAFHNLLVALLKFLEPYLRNAELGTPIRLLYKGTLKILLVLLHDFSEFLCDYHFTLCDVIPATCIQMRNLILSAFPRHMRLPDPFTPNLKVDLLPEINQVPKISSKYGYALEKFKLKEKVDAYMKNRAPATFLADLKQRLTLTTKEALQCGTRYNVPLMNSLVIYAGVQAINQLQVTSVRAPIVSSPAMDIFQRLVLDADPEGRYVFLNALVNHLRFPNNQTHYFSCVLLYLFAEVKLEQDDETIQEQITRVLLERLVVNRPHPWGLLITFIELIKNPRYAFWDKKFIHCAPEIENLFENVGRSCMNLNR